MNWFVCSHTYIYMSCGSLIVMSLMGGLDVDLFIVSSQLTFHLVHLCTHYISLRYQNITWHLLFSHSFLQSNLYGHNHSTVVMLSRIPSLTIPSPVMRGFQWQLSRVDADVKPLMSDINRPNLVSCKLHEYLLL